MKIAIDFAVHDKVWTIYENRVTKMEIKFLGSFYSSEPIWMVALVPITSQYLDENKDKHVIREIEDVFKTKEELIQSL